VQILTFSTLYPSAARPQHGIFVETRLRKLVESGAVNARVMAPCPWFPFSSRCFGRYSDFGRSPRSEVRHGLHVSYPRYPQLPKVGMGIAPLALFSAVLPVLQRQIRAGHDFDLIDAHYFYPDGVAAVLLGRALDRPVVVTARGSDLNVIAEFAVPRRWIRWAVRHADGLVAVSSGLQRRLVGLGISEERVCVLRNGVDPTLFRPTDRAAARVALGLTRPTLLAVGNLVGLKRHRLMVEALAGLPECDLIIVGEGPERAAITELAQALRLADRVRLLGRVPQDRLPEIYTAADLLLLVSSSEGWPNVLLESMACGTAVIVSDIDGIEDIVAAPEAGVILPETTPSLIAAAVRDFFVAPPDRAATRAHAERFDWRSTTEGQIALFHKTCRGRARRMTRLYTSA
jgi:glycosyltransferase involved in cell wall biosynthesis